MQKLLWLIISALVVWIVEKLADAIVNLIRRWW